MKTSIKQEYIFAIPLFFVWLSCSKTEHEKEATYKAEASFIFSGTDTWPEKYHIAIGAFTQNATTPSAYTIIDKTGENDTVAIELDIPGTTDHIRLYLAGSDNQVLSTFYQYPVSETTSDIQIPQQAINLVTFSRMQGQIFNSCTACHGGSSGSPAAGLYLVEGSSWSYLVNVPAVNSDKKRVMPSDTAQSFLLDVMRRRGISFTHSASYSLEEEDISLTKAWINKGALND